MEKKYPKLASGWAYFKEVWDETFPDPDKQMRKRMEMRREIAKQQREHEEKLAKMTPEEIEELEKAIPEWKRTAMVVTDQGEGEEKKSGIFGKLSEKIGETEAAKKFYESEDYQKLKAVRSNYEQFKSNLQDGVETSQSPLVQRTAQIYDTAKMESACGRAVKAMQAYDPYF